MKVRFHAAVTGLSALVLTAGLLVAGATSALAATPPYEPDPADQIGQINFYDATGHNVTSGDINDDPFAKYALATNNDPHTSNTVATLYAYTPVNGVLPANWSGEQLTAATHFPVTGAPSPIGSAGAHRPVVTLDTTAHGNINLAGYIADFPNTAASGSPYEGLYQLRIKTAGNDPKFWAADVKVTGSTWAQVYPAPTPPPTGTVALTGKHRVGFTDTCVKSFTHATTFTYKWFVGTTQIAGATHATYRISEKYYKRTIHCQVRATGAGGSKTVNSAGHTVGIGPALVPIKKPYLFHGTNRTTVKHGHTESVAHGTWKPAAKRYTYQWFVGTKKIIGATHTTFTPGRGAIGKKIFCVVTAHRLAWTNGRKKTAGVTVT